MPWGPAPMISLVLPEDAGPNDPQIDIGTDNPPDLVAYYAGFGDTLIQSFIFRANATDYTYLALVVGGGIPFMALGSSNAAGVNEMETIFQIGANPELILGSGGVGLVAISPGSFFSIRAGAGFGIDGVIQGDRKSTRLNSSHTEQSRMPSSA